MTSTPIKDVGTVMNLSASTGTKSSTGANAADFQKYLSSETGRDSKEIRDANAKVRKPKEGTKPEDTASKVEGEAKADGKAEAPEETLEEQDAVLEEEQIEEAMEVLSTAAIELIQQIADAFGMTVEEVQGLMEQMNMEQIDVMNPQALGELLLAAGGEEDSLSLLTNEKLYTVFQDLMKEQGTLLEQGANTLGMDVEQLISIVEEPKPLPAEAVMEQLQGTEEMLTEDTAKDVVPKGIENAESVTDMAAQRTMSDQSGNEKQDKQETGADRNQTGNLVLQTMKSDVTEASLQQLTEITSAWDAETRDIMQQILDYMKIQIKPDMSSLEMQLHPASLGTLHIQVASRQGALTANFITENETVKAALESQMVQLKESFAEQGVKVEAIEVTVQTHEFERNLDQGRGGRQQEPEKKSRTRRINLNDLSAMDSMDYMEEEEKLAADIMTASGNTVDYTA